MGKRQALVVAGAVVSLGVVAAVGVIAGRLTAPGPDIVVTSGAIADEAQVSGLPVFEPVDAYAVPRPVSLVPAPGLPNEPGMAPGFRLMRGGVSGEGLARGLSIVLDVPGDVVRTADGWSLATTDGRGGELTVHDDDAYSWEYLANPADLGSMEGQPLPSDARARRIAEALLADAGVDLDDAAVEVARRADGVEVTAWQLADGLRTSLGWSMLIGPRAVVLRAAGFGSALEPSAPYPIVGAAAAVTRVGSAPWSGLGPVRLIGEEGLDAEILEDSADVVGQDPAASKAGVLQVEQSTLTVEAAELALAQYSQPDGAVLILPSYVLTADDASQWSVPAVSEEYVDFVPAPLPRQQARAGTVNP